MLKSFSVLFENLKCCYAMTLTTTLLLSKYLCLESSSNCASPSKHHNLISIAGDHHSSPFRLLISFKFLLANSGDNNLLWGEPSFTGQQLQPCSSRTEVTATARQLPSNLGFPCVEPGFVYSSLDALQKSSLFFATMAASSRRSSVLT